MKKIILTILFAVFLSNTAIAASSPPKGFIDEKIYTYDGNRLSWGEVGELVQCFKVGGSSTSWESAGNSWILHAKHTDKLTKKVQKTDLLFDYKKFSEDVNRVYLTRIIVNKEEIKPEMLLSSPNVMACWKKEIKEAEIQSKKQATLDEEAIIIREKDEEAKRLAEIEATKEKDRLEFEANKRKLEADEKIRSAEEVRLKARANQEKEIAAIEKQKAIARLAGLYENQQKSKGKPKGNIKVDVISEDRIMLNLHMKNSDGDSCDIENQEAAIDYYGNRKVIKASIGNEDEDRKNRTACFISLKFSESSMFGFIVEANQTGCKSYCKRVGNMDGRYIKTFIQ